MTTDNKTLADVQPGGRVRLGDQAERARFEAWAISRGWSIQRWAEGAQRYCNCDTEKMWEAFQAALSAQPSPGGQEWPFVESPGQFAERLADAMREFDLLGAVRHVLVEKPPALAARQPVGDQCPDDLAVDAFAAAMKAKMAAARAKGRGGWEDPAQCSAEDLSRMLRNHVEKGDPRDVANFCMMLHQRGEAIAARQPVCGTCNATIQPDALTGTKCACSHPPTAWLIEWKNGVTALTKDPSEAEQHQGLRNCTVVPVYAARQPVASNQPSGNSGELDVDGARQPVGEPVLWVSPEVLDAMAIHRAQDFPAGGMGLACRAGSATVPLYLGLPAQAAVQPVGYFDPDVLAHLTEELIDPVGVLRRKPNGKSNVPVWLGPPAQAVDLDDFKALYRAYVRLLESGRDRIRDLGGTCDPVDVMEANDVDLQAARRVIDSQAVGE